jgi:glycosyltransferase involved in cell wall biosynthesis
MVEVSVIIPSYNSAHLLKDSLNSVIASNFLKFEIIVIDDGSNDNTKDIIRPFLIDGRINYIFQNNKGLSGARNSGIKRAKGEYLVFLDADDLILPDKLKVQSEYLFAHPEIDIIYSNSQWFVEDDFTDTRPVRFPIYEGNVFNQLIYGNFMHVNSIMVRREKVIEVGLFDESLRELEDWDLWLRMVLNGSKIGFTPGIFSKVRIRKGSMTSNQNKMDMTMVRVLQKTIQNLNPDHPIQIKAHHALLIYQLKTGETKGYFKSIIKFQIHFGFKFLPIAFKQIIKFLFKRWTRQNQTTAEMEQIWNA